jgi:dephospho-CoA kinase
MSQLRRIGLTGGIATGKSTVARLLAEQHGIPVLDADHFAREALAPGSIATQAVIRRYGPSVQSTIPGHRGHLPCLDRSAVGRLIFADPLERQWLEQLIHPVVRQRFAEALEGLAEAPTVTLMIPLLFEAGLEGMCSEIWVVDCGSESEQIRRLMSRDQLNVEAAQARLRAQWPMAEKRARADVVLSNSGSKASLAEQVRAAVNQPIVPGDRRFSVAAAQPAVAPTAPGDPPAA